MFIDFGFKEIEYPFLKHIYKEMQMIKRF